MHVPSWLSPWRQVRRTVAGLALQAGGVDWVIMAGTPLAPDTLCCAEHLKLPVQLQTALAAGNMQAVGAWLRGFVRERDHQVEGVCLAVDDAWVSTYMVNLPQALSGDDVHFQLMAELEALHVQGLSHTCVAYTPVAADLTPESLSAVQRYQVGVIAQARVEALEHMAQAADMRVLAIEPSAEAVQRTQSSDNLSALPVASVALGLQCEVAFGLALGAWTNTGLRFSPSPAQQARHMRRLWWTRTAAVLSVGVVSGGVLAAGLATWSMSPTDRPDAAASQRALNAAKQEELALRTQVQQAQARTQWWRTQTAWQHRTVQWSQVLAQHAHGVWVSQVHQQDRHWVVQGEALSSAHMQQLLHALNALDIWAQAPHAQRLQLTQDAATRVMATWQFRIEADLKDSPS